MSEETLHYPIKSKTVIDLIKSAKYHSNKFQTSCQKIMKARYTRCLEDITAYEVTNSNKFDITRTPCCYHFVHKECLNKLYERSARLPPSAELKCNACEGVYSDSTLNLQCTRQNKFFVGPSETCCIYMNRDLLIQDVCQNKFTYYYLYICFPEFTGFVPRHYTRYILAITVLSSGEWYFTA